MRIKCRQSASAFTRKRLLPFTTVVALIINLIKKSLQLEISSFLGFLKYPDASKQAFSQARRNLSPEVFKLLNERLITEFYSDNQVKTLKDFRVLAVDGSTLCLPDTQEIQNAYGTAATNRGQTIPMAKASILFDVFNNLTLHSIISPFRTSERHMAMQHIQSLETLNTETKNNQTRDLILFDRGYPSLFLMFFLQNKKTDFLIRSYKHFLTEIEPVLCSGAKDTILTIFAFKKGRVKNSDFEAYLPHLEKDATIQLRVLVYDLPDGKKEIILTSLVNQNLFTYDDIFKLYAKRWRVEEAYKFYKNLVELENFSGEAKITIEQDFFATIFTSNVASLLAQEAQDEIDQEYIDKKRKYAYKINRNIAIGTIKNEIIKIFLEDHDLDVYCKQLKERMKRGLVSIRPGRSFYRHAPTKRSSYIQKRAL